MLYSVCQLGARTHYAIVIQSTCVLTAHTTLQLNCIHNFFLLYPIKANYMRLLLHITKNEKKNCTGRAFHLAIFCYKFRRFFGKYNQTYQISNGGVPRSLVVTIQGVWVRISSTLVSLTWSLSLNSNDSLVTACTSVRTCNCTTRPYAIITIPVLTWESYKGNARTRDAYRTVCFITRRTCWFIFGERKEELLYWGWV